MGIRKGGPTWLFRCCWRAARLGFSYGETEVRAQRLLAGERRFLRWRFAVNLIGLKMNLFTTALNFMHTNTHDRDNWPQMVEWLHDHLQIYTSILEREL